MRKRIKEVNGVRIIRRYGIGSIFSGLICLAICAIPVLMLFVPWMKFTPSDSNLYYSLDMIDCLTATFGKTNDVSTNVVDVIKGVSSPIQSWIGLLYNIINISGIVLVGILILIDLVMLFLGLEFLFRGKVSHFKLASILSIFGDVIIIIWLLIALTIKFIFQFSNIGFEVEMYHDFIYGGVAIVYTIVLSILYSTCFRNRVFIGDLGDLRHFSGSEEKEENAEIRLQTKEVVKVRYEAAKGLPPKLSSIGGHAFSQNMNLEIAMIPNGIKTLGQGAFSNCGNLQIVSIPLSVKSIGFNCFWNCVKLKRINYAGSKEQWRHVKRGSNWLPKAGSYTVVCNDGPIIVNPYH